MSLNRYGKKSLFKTFILLSIVTAVLFVAFWFYKNNYGSVVLRDSVPGIGKSFALQISTYDPPLVIQDGTVQSMPSAIPWLNGFLIVNGKIPLPSYDTFKDDVSPEYITEFKITPNKYAQLVRSFEGRKTPFILTIWYSVEVTCESGSFAFIVQTIGKAKSDNFDKSDLALTLMKKIDNKWKVYPSTKGNPVLKVPWNNLHVLREIKKSQLAHLDASGKFAPN